MMVNSRGIHLHNNLFLICELQWTQKKDKRVVSSKSGIGLLPKNIQNIEHICWEAIHTKSAVQTHGQLQTPSWSVTVSFAWSSHVSISLILTSIHFLEDGTGLTQFLCLFHKIQISTWKPTPWRYPYVVLARISWVPILVETEGSHWVVGQTPFRSHFCEISTRPSTCAELN